MRRERYRHSDLMPDDARDHEPNEINNIFQTLAQAMVRVHFPATDEHGHPSLGRFFLENGRLPHLGDEVEPWAYPGWIVPYIQLCEGHAGIPARYDYVLRTLDAGELLEEPIPQHCFVGEGSQEAAPGMKMLEQMVRIGEYRHGSHRAFEMVCQWLGFGLGVTHELSALDGPDQEKLYRIFDVSKWLTAPTDYLGLFMAENSYGKAGGFFPTPMTLCTMMAKLVYGDGDQRVTLAHDPCVGTGRTLLAASNYSLRLFGQDINWLCVLVAKINFALFAPWHLIPAGFFPVDELTPAPVTPRTSEEVAPGGRNGPGSAQFTTEIEQLTLFEV